MQVVMANYLIGNTLLKSLAAKDRPYEVRDSRLKGFLVRVQPSGVMTYYLEYGRGKRMSLGRVDAVKPNQARERAKNILGIAFSGKDPRAELRGNGDITFRKFIKEIYRPWAETNIRRYDETIKRIEYNFRDFKSKKLKDITPWQIEKWRSARLASGIKRTTANRDFSDLRACLNKAVTWGFIDENPAGKVQQLKIDRLPRPRFLSADEENRLRDVLDAREERLRRARISGNEWRQVRGYQLYAVRNHDEFTDHLKPLVILSLNTGCRRGELFSLKWEDVDLDQAQITIRAETAKSGQTRYIPLNEEAETILRSWKEQCGIGYVFPGRNGAKLNNVKKSWGKVLGDAGIINFRWHDLRHTFASRLVQAGVDLNTVRELLGHSSYAMTLRYAHLAPEHKAEAVAKLVS